jgi:glycosyltransferase involved in cell wall biosynthesis
MTYEQIDGLISFVSNSPGQPTGYGQQGAMLVERMVRHGIKVAALSNYGLEGVAGELEFSGKKIPHYPRGFKQYSDDVIQPWHEDFLRQNPGVPDAVFTLYDVWVYNDVPPRNDFPTKFISWVPLDHQSLPPAVAKWLLRPNVTPITMSPHGQRQLEGAGISSTYIPHAIDTKVFKPRETMSDGVKAREYLGVKPDEFLVGVVSANKANGLIHRKAYSELILAWSIFLKSYPKSKLYIHTEPSGIMGGFDLPVLLQACGVPSESIIFPERDRLRKGYSQEDMAALYSAFDVLGNPSYGEGFGIPAVEAQACGTRVIASGWAASADLVAEDGWLLQGIPFWDEPQKAWWSIPLVDSIHNALVEAYKADRGPSKVARDFASQFDAERVWKWGWLPFLREYFAS